MTPQMEKIYQHLCLFNSLKYISYDLEATEPLVLEPTNNKIEEKNSDKKWDLGRSREVEKNRET